MTGPGPANLFLIGAMKSGTTTLSSYLSAHPDIFMCEPKEPHYYVEELNPGKGQEWYEELFRSGADSVYRGDASTTYSMHPKFAGVPRRISMAAPDARLIYIIREPLSRIISHHWHMVQFHGGHSDIHSALASHPQWIDYSRYAFQIEQYLQVFDRSQICVVTFEDLCADPFLTVNGIFEWLGLTQLNNDRFSVLHKNRTPDRIPVSGGALNRLADTSAWNWVSPFVPKFAKSAMKRLTGRSFQKQLSAESIDRITAQLSPIFQEDAIALSNILNRDYTKWANTTE